MAYFPPFTGDAQPVFAMDINNGPQTGTISSDALVQMDGPKLDFFTLTANAALTNAGNVNGYLTNVLTSIQQTGTIALYQAGATAGTISLAIYPTGAYTTATLVTAAQVANASGGLKQLRSRFAPRPADKHP